MLSDRLFLEFCAFLTLTVCWLCFVICLSSDQFLMSTWSCVTPHQALVDILTSMPPLKSHQQLSKNCAFFLKLLEPSINFWGWKCKNLKFLLEYPPVSASSVKLLITHYQTIKQELLHPSIWTVICLVLEPWSVSSELICIGHLAAQLTSFLCSSTIHMTRRGFNHEQLLFSVKFSIYLYNLNQWLVLNMNSELCSGIISRINIII